MGLIFVDAFVVLVTLTIWRVVVHRSVVIDQLIFPNNGDSVHKRIDVLSVMDEIEVVSHEFAAKRKGVYGG